MKRFLLAIPLATTLIMGAGYADTITSCPSGFAFTCTQDKCTPASGTNLGPWNFIPGGPYIPSQPGQQYQATFTQLAIFNGVRLYTGCFYSIKPNFRVQGGDETILDYANGQKSAYLVPISGPWNPAFTGQPTNYTGSCKDQQNCIVKIVN